MHLPDLIASWECRCRGRSSFQAQIGREFYPGAYDAALRSHRFAAPIVGMATLLTSSRHGTYRTPRDVATQPRP